MAMATEWLHRRAVWSRSRCSRGRSAYDGERPPGRTGSSNRTRPIYRYVVNTHLTKETECAFYVTLVLRHRYDADAQRHLSALESGQSLHCALMATATSGDGVVDRRVVTIERSRDANPTALNDAQERTRKMGRVRIDLDELKTEV